MPTVVLNALVALDSTLNIFVFLFVVVVVVVVITVVVVVAFSVILFHAIFKLGRAVHLGAHFLILLANLCVVPFVRVPRCLVQDGTGHTAHGFLQFSLFL